MGVPGLLLGLADVGTIRLEEEIHSHRFFPVSIILVRLQDNATIKEMVLNLYKTS